MVDSIPARYGWAFGLVSAALLGAFWYAHVGMDVGWARWGYMAVAGAVSLAALAVTMSAFMDAGGGGAREWHALAIWYALVNQTPWWGKAVVVLGAVSWGPGPWGWG